MNPRIKKRLDTIEDKFRPVTDKSCVVFMPLPGESESEYDERIQRWYAGERVEGQEKLYTNPNQQVMRIVYVDMERKFSVRGTHSDMQLF
jgi:hypothetical protein